MDNNEQTNRLKNWANDPSALFYARLAKLPVVADGAAVALIDLTECDFPGYSAQKLVEFEGVFPQQEGIGQVMPKPFTFEAGDGLVEPQRYHAVYVTRHVADGPAELVQVVLLDPPGLMESPGDTYSGEVTFSCLDFPS